MLGKLLAQALVSKLSESQSSKNQRLKRKEDKRVFKNSMINLVGKPRYYLAELFGQWVYFTWNHRDYSEILYQKFYTTNESANRYAERLKKKYTIVSLEPVYDKHKQIGFMLYGKGKKIEVCKPQPSNVIQFPSLPSLK